MWTGASSRTDSRTRASSPNTTQWTPHCGFLRPCGRFFSTRASMSSPKRISMTCWPTSSTGTCAVHATGEAGVQLTWMDAKVGDWVVTPRYGKAVEIQALWYNALCVMEGLADEFGNKPGKKRYGEMSALVNKSFNRVFWNDAAGCLYDVVNGDARDGSLPPKQ